MSKMLLITTPSVEGKTIKEYLGVVIGVRGHLKDALVEMEKEATELGADAIIGIHISSFGGHEYLDGEFRRDVIGTAVKFK